MLSDFAVEKLKDFYKNEITEEFLLEISTHSEFLELNKGEILFSDKDIKLRNFLLLEGSLVRFIITDKGEEKAISFHTESFLQFVGKVFIETENTQIQHFVKVNEPAKILAIDSHFVNEALAKYPFFAQKIYAVILEYIRITSSIQDHFLGLNSADFLRWLWEKHPFLFQRFQSKDIANFMSITPEWISKLKRKILQK